MTPKQAFIVFRNPFAALLARKMMKIKKKENTYDENSPKMFK